MSTKRKTAFKKLVLDFYRRNGRHSLPWRKTKNPYHILVSELMLQQTQVERVIPKYTLFIKHFPTLLSLATSPQKEVLKLWSGLGYNRRAKFLHQSAQIILKAGQTKLPRTKEALLKLPGVGEYTASALMAFAYNEPVLLIETNIRTVYIHHFFKNKKNVSDKDILLLLQQTLDTKSPRDWYAALMDYGTYLKSTGNKAHQRARVYTKQSQFKGSQRELRGYILKALTQGPQTYQLLKKNAPETTVSTALVLEALIAEKFIEKKGARYRLI